MKKHFVILMASLLAVSAASCGKKKTLDLEKDEYIMYVGDTDTIKTEKGSKFTSLSNGIVEVSNDGVLTAKSIGSTIVTVDNGKTKNVCYVVVIGDKPIDIVSLSITNKQVEIEAGSTYKFEYAKNPINADNYNSLKWTSSNTSVLRIDGAGNVTTIAPGKAVVKIEATGTNFSDTVEVNVKARKSTLNLNCVNAVGNIGTSDLTLIPNLFTDYKDISLGTWTSSNEDIIKVENGLVSFIAEGSAVVTYTITAGEETLSTSCKLTAVNYEGYKVIRTPEQLQAIENTSGNYMLGNDIDLKEACSKGGSLFHGGAGFAPLFSDAKNAFKGTFDGMGYSIKNINIYSTNAFTALFSFVSNVSGKEGVIKRLNLVGGSITGGNYTAALVGRFSSTQPNQNACISNCFVNVEVNSFGLGAGLVGYNTGKVESCICLSRVNATQAAAITLRQDGTPMSGCVDCYALDQEIEAIPLEKLNSGICTVILLIDTELTDASKYVTLDTNFWNINDGSIPTLKTMND